MECMPAACKGYCVIFRALGVEGCALVEHVAQHLVARADQRQRPRRGDAQVVHGFAGNELAHAAPHDRPAIRHAAVWRLARALSMLTEVCCALLCYEFKDMAERRHLSSPSGCTVSPAACLDASPLNEASSFLLQTDNSKQSQKSGIVQGPGTEACHERPGRPENTLSCSSYGTPSGPTAWPRLMALPSPSCPAHCDR